MTAHLDRLASLAASLPPGAVLAHVVTDALPYGKLRPRAWAKIGDEPWRSVSAVDVSHARCSLWVRPATTGFVIAGTWSVYDIVTDSVVWEGYGLRGRHEVMGVVG